MESTEQFVARVQEEQRKNEENAQHQGKAHASKHLPTKQHSTRK